MLTERPTDRSLNLMPIAPDPICPACGSRIVSGSVVFYNDDHLTHIDCHNGILTDAADKIIAVLARHPGADFCHTCLAGQLDIAHEAVQKGIVRLRMNAEVTIRIGDCSRCQRPRVTVRARIFGRGRAVADD